MLSEIINSISSFTIISRFTGFLLFSIDCQTESIIITKFNILNIFFTILVNCCCTVFFWTKIVSIFNDQDIIVKSASPILLCSDHYVNIFIIIWLFSKRRKICEALKILRNIQQNFEEIGVKVDHKKHKRTINFYTLGIVGIFIAIVCFGIIKHYKNGTKVSSLAFAFSLWCFVLDTAFMFQYILSIAVIGVKFEKLNKNLDKIDENQIVQKIHMQIARYIHQINKIYGPPLIASFAVIFFWGCFSFFEIITIEKKIEFLFDIATYFINLAVTSLNFYFLFMSTARTEKARKTAINKMFAMMQKDSDKKELYQEFILQLVHVNVNFSCGMFDINWQFLYHLVATAAMYFIVLLQFYASSK